MSAHNRTGLLAGTAALALTAAAAGLAAGTVEWGYHGDVGPENWGFLLDDNGHVAFPTCAVGEAQSPVDIRGFSETDDGPLIRFDYGEVPLTVRNNGHTIQVDYQPGSAIRISGDTFNLLQFHFHTPSEHEILGLAAPMELHLVHSRSVGDNVELAVVGVMIEQGDHNAALQRIWDVMPAEEGVIEVAGATIDADALLPGDTEEYYAYSGSLTTPPCTEDVRWHVLEDTIEASAAQIAEFQAIFDMNARPVQALFGRKISLVED